MAVVLRFNRQPNIGITGKIKSGRHHTDNSAIVSVDSQPLAEHRRIAGKTRLPDMIAQNNNGIWQPFPRLIKKGFAFLFRQKVSPEQWLYTQRRECVWGNPGRANASRPAAIRYTYRIRTAQERSDIFENLVIVTPFVKLFACYSGDYLLPIRTR